MTKREFCQIWLTCKDKVEATKITKALLDKYLIACAKQIPVTSDYWWKGKVDHSNEVLLLMESQESLFGDIESEVARLHIYDTFVLYSTPISKLSIGAQEWLEDVLANEI